MLAVMQTGGKQYLVQEGKTLKIEKLPGDIGSELIFDKVLMVGNPDGTGIKIGRPTVSGATVKASILEQAKDKKIRVIKFKRKVRYKRERGHRQYFTKIKITSVASQ